MEARLNHFKTAPDATKLMVEMEKYIHQTNLEPDLLELVKVRASQINGCAFCLDMHWKDARAQGETEQRLYGLDAWREADYYTEKERAGLALTEAVTEIATNHVSDELYEEVRNHFNEKDFTDLIFAINAINNWNRLSIAMRTVPGRYQASDS
ncbi:MAG TPA: carboxymuconolactone decarboxylase family protein [Pseudogracilibacillus sp.]|nr:carboxymuconolactone decarboxylase family protein [Pseudogracilibacillus sp.]